jgi:uncharacterized protein (DUF2267 family)
MTIVSMQLRNRRRSLMVHAHDATFHTGEPHPILGEIERHVALPEGATAASAFTAVMSTLSRRLTLGEARHLVQAVTPDVRPLIEPALHGREERPDPFGRDELFARVGAELHTDQPEPIIRAVIHAVEKYLSRLAFKHVRSQLPGEIRQLWTAPA